MNTEACQAEKEQGNMRFKRGRTTRNRPALAGMPEPPRQARRSHGRYAQKLAR